MPTLGDTSSVTTLWVEYCRGLNPVSASPAAFSKMVMNLVGWLIASMAHNAVLKPPTSPVSA